ncbi:MAG: SIR2 family protein [Candidatus Celaenobacter antarcticus]|nr:SIR2 family protein [Candidatus Celaenobacter antarcticus]
MFKDIKRLESDDIRFCFLIGAGASKSSGIPTGWELSEEWYNDLKEDLNEDELQKWENEINFDISKIGEFYPHLYRKRYEISPQVGYDEFKKMMENVDPGLGYVILSQILANEKHNFVITTNFDYLIEDAVRMYTSTKPFSAGHETLAEFISSQTERPTIIKIHRDLFLHPFNDEEKTQELKEQWKKALLPILKNFNLLIIGYGGNDGSLMNYLNEIDIDNRKLVYWCARNNDTLNDKINNLLTAKDYVVTIDGFDELMYSLYKALDYDTFENLDDVENHQFVIAAKKRITSLNDKRKELFNKIPKDKKTEISENAKNIFTGASQYLLDAYLEKDDDKKEKIYKKGLMEYPDDADLLSYYAVFLKNIRKDYDKSEEYYKKAIELDPKVANNIGNYANFLSDIRRDYNKAEEYYKKAIELKPDDADFIGNYAHHLIISKQDFVNAEKYINNAFDLVDNNNFSLLAELWFYRYAHYKQYLKQGERELEKLCSQNAKSIGWDLHDHIEIAKEKGHPDIKKLQKFADKITK